jgi:hypothetical protein
MPFTINEFKSTMMQYGGPARKNIFEVNLNVIDSVTGRPDHIFFCKTVSVPGINVNVQTYMPNAFGIMQSVPVSTTHDQLNCVFILDSSHMILSFFHRWMQQVVNYDVSGGIFSQVNDQLPYEFGYKDDYVTTMTIKHYSTDYSGYYEYTFNDVFPTQVSGVDLSWEENDSYATATVNFSYSTMKFDGTKAGEPTDRFARGTGLVDYINRLGTSGQVINQSTLPRSIQEAIDSFVAIRNIGATLRSIFK